MFLRKPDSSGSDGRSTHWPVTSYFQPWYWQRMPQSALSPNQSEAPRWAQNSSIRPTRPLLSRKAISLSPISLTLTGGQSGSGISDASRKGAQ